MVLVCTLYCCSFTLWRWVIKEQAYLTPKLLSAQNGTLKCPCLQANHTQPPSFELWRLNSFLFFVQPKFMKRLDRPHNRRSLVLCAWKGTKESSREVGLFLSLSVHNLDAIFLHQPPLVVPLYSWLHVLCATFWRISGFPGPPIASTYCGVKQCNTFYNSYTRIIYALSSRF